MCLVTGSLRGYAKEVEEVGNLYAQSAVLMDGNSGRVLFEKNGEEFLANASTTKILTCILALEKAKEEEIVTVSSYAASMPDVQLHIREGERYYLKDLLYSLMLESHNDVAVAIAEHIAGSSKKFSVMMNEKAREIGCENTFFLTPNGLDATENVVYKDGREEMKFHGTTAKDLALIMRYCMKLSEKKEDFLRITAAPTYSFQDVEGKRNFICRNHNSFLQMMEGAISGKTGFTGKAGYCYVGALEREGKSYIVALLACGWPGNKNYKWQDSRNLMEYGLKNYHLFFLKDLEKEYGKEMSAKVIGGVPQNLGETASVSLTKKRSKIETVLVKESEKVTAEVIKEKLEAPVKENTVAGTLKYFIDNEAWMEEKLYCENSVKNANFMWSFRKIWCFFLLIDI